MTEIIEVKQDFVSDYASVLYMVAIAQLTLMGMISFFIFTQVMAVPNPIYFKLTTDDQIIEQVPLDLPAISNAALLNLVNEAVNQAYTFNYRNLKNQVDILKPYFDERGLTSYVKVLREDENMSAVVPDKLIVSAKVQKAPQVVREGNLKGRYTWQIKFPLLVRYENKSILRRQEMDMDIIVWRVPETVSPNRVKITTIRTEIKQRYNVEANRVPGAL